MDTKSLKVQCQAALALRNLASDGKNTLLMGGVEVDLRSLLILSLLAL